MGEISFRFPKQQQHGGYYFFLKTRRLQEKMVGNLKDFLVFLFGMAQQVAGAAIELVQGLCSVHSVDSEGFLPPPRNQTQQFFVGSKPVFLLDCVEISLKDLSLSP